MFLNKETYTFVHYQPMETKFSVQFLSDVTDFLDSLDEKPREKILYNIYKARLINDVDLFKKLVDDIWEFRTLYNKTQYRLLAFWDSTDNRQTLVIATNAFIKKTQKTPKTEIDRAKNIRKLYFEQKSKK